MTTELSVSWIASGLKWVWCDVRDCGVTGSFGHCFRQKCIMSRDLRNGFWWFWQRLLGENQRDNQIMILNIFLDTFWCFHEFSLTKCKAMVLRVEFMKNKQKIEFMKNKKQWFWEAVTNPHVRFVSWGFVAAKKAAKTRSFPMQLAQQKTRVRN